MHGQNRSAMNVRRLVTRLAFGLVALIMIRAAYIPLAEAFTHGETGLDFRCYYAAAWMVRGHSSDAIYSSIGKDMDPTEASPDPNSIFARTANAHGVPDVYAYVYPPTLADLLVPFTFVSVSTALHIWYVLNIAALAGAGIIFVRTPGQELSKYAVPFLFYLFVSTPTVDCLLCGQVPILLLLPDGLRDPLLCPGRQIQRRGVFCARGGHQADTTHCGDSPDCLGRLEGIARDWAMVRGYRRHPSGREWPQRPEPLYFPCFAIDGKYCHRYRFQIAQHPGSGFVDSFRDGCCPTGCSLGGKDSHSLCNLPGWLAQLQEARGQYKEDARVETIAIFLFLSACIAPVSWRHAYLLAAPALLYMGKRAWEGQSSVFEDAMLLTFIVAVSTNRFLEQPLLTPLSGIVLCFLGLYRLRSAHPFVRRPHGPVEVPAT